MVMPHPEDCLCSDCVSARQNSRREHAESLVMFALATIIIAVLCVALWVMTPRGII